LDDFKRRFEVTKWVLCHETRLEQGMSCLKTGLRWQYLQREGQTHSGEAS